MFLAMIQMMIQMMINHGTAVVFLWLKTKKAGVTSPAAAKLNWIKNYFGVCRLWASTCVPSFRV